MITREVLIDVIFDQKKTASVQDTVPRIHIEESILQNDLVVVISGVRRCGKSVFLQQIREKCPQKDYFINFDDDRLINFTVDDFQLLYEIFIELYGKQNYFFFDEIQNIDKWERFIRRLHDQRNKVFITGSNATMLSNELGTHLTGRYYQSTLYPFSFKEYLLFKSKSILLAEIKGTSKRAEIKRDFNEYFRNGGMPGFLVNDDKNYLKMQYEGLLYRDILARNKILKEHQVKELIYFIASNLGKEISFNALAKIIGVSQASTVKDYLAMSEDAYLSFLLPRFDSSVKKQLYANKKVYFIDNALADNIGFRFSEDKGRFLENLVFIELKRNHKDFFYYKDKYECDFVIRLGRGVEQLIQVSVSLSNPEVRKREERGLIDAAKGFKVNKGLILTEDDEEDYVKEDIRIIVKPVWKWLLEN